VASEIAEIELILATSEALIELGLERPRIRLNDRRILTAMASFCGVDPSRHGEFFVTLDKLDKIGRDGVERELREAGHDESAIAKLFALFVTPGEASPDAALDTLAPTIGTADEAVDGLRTILRTVEREAGGRYTVVFDPSLVRGMGYYTGPIFEAAYGDSTSSIAGGGRYDRMVGRLLGHDVPACGFSIGFERVVSILEARRGAAEPERDRVALLFEDHDALPDVVGAAAELRRGARIVSLTQKRKNLARQLDDLAGEGFGSYAVFRAGQGVPDLKPLGRRPERGAAGA
jgi:histidyl-tRNA synthetase